MAFQVSLLLTADGDVAAAEVRKVGAATKEAAADAEALGKKSGSAGAGVKGLGRAADQADDKINSLGAAKRKAARDAKLLEKSNRRAAGATGNLIAQFNDVGVMMMAGQNPLQLAVQQGTQITQVIGPMGAAGAVKSLGTALVGMLNPINLVTIGSLAAGAAIVNWLTDAGEEAASFEDRLAATKDALKQFEEAQKSVSMGAVDMLEKFGTTDPMLKTILADMTALQKIDLYRSLASQANGVRDLVLDLSFFDERSSQSAAQDFLGLGSLSSSARAAGAEFARNLELLSRSEEPAVKLKAALDLRQQLLDTAGGLDNLKSSQVEFYNSLAATIRDLILIGAKVDQVGAAPNENMKALNKLWQELKVSAADYIQERLKENKSARSTLVDLQEQAAIQEAIVRYGAGSARVAEMRQLAEKRAFEEMLSSLNVSEELKQELKAAFLEGQSLANLDVATGISAAADQAARLARQLGVSLATAMGIVNLQSSKKYSGRGSDPRAFENGGSQADYQNRLDYTPIEEIISRFNRSGRSGGGARAADREREAIVRLIASEQEQLDLLRETDPVQKEMIRNREALAGATDAERAAVERLISERLAEQEAMEGLQERQDFFNQTLYDAFDGLLLQGASLEDVLGNIARALAQAALQAAILGEGPLAKLFGWTTPLFSFSGGGEIPALASGGGIPAPRGGGKIYGPGGGADDKVLMWGSSGEFMMNARATARYRHLLEAMNNNASIPRLAVGGAVDGSRAFATGALEGRTHLRVELVDGLKAQLVEASVGQSVEIMGQQLDHYDRTLPRRMDDIQRDRRKVG